MASLTITPERCYALSCAIVILAAACFVEAIGIVDAVLLVYKEWTMVWLVAGRMPT